MEDSHILLYFDELKESGIDPCEVLNWILTSDPALGREHSYHPVRLHKGAVYGTVHGEGQLFLKDGWARPVQGGEYPRFHLLPSRICFAFLDEQLVVGVRIDAHIDEDVHRTDRSSEARTLVEKHLESLREKFRERLMVQWAQQKR